jgi:hypothetical protein
MLFNPRRLGAQGVTDEDLQYRGSTFSEVRNALFANGYYLVWRGPEEPPLPIYEISLGRTLMGIGRYWYFQHAARRTVDTFADLRWGVDRKGFRRIAHPNGVCLTGTWEIDADAATNYSGYFAAGRRGLIVARYSCCCNETRSGHYRSLALVGKIYPTTDPQHTDRLRPASFITQGDIGGSKALVISDVELRNAPDTTPWRRGAAGFFNLLATGIVLLRADKEPTMRQVYEIAELGKAPGEPTRAPEFMRLLVEPSSVASAEDVDIRDEILGRIYDEGANAPRRTLTFDIEVSDTGTTRGRVVQRRTITGWTRIGRIVFREAVASYNGDFVIHFHHPKWRTDRNDPASVARRPRSRSHS